jgi:curved DNA-binding protein CbpA
VKDYYRILGIPRDATPEALKAAYLRLAKKFHPDVNSQDQDWAAGMFKDVSEAYETLSVPTKRKLYDLQLSGQIRSMPAVSIRTAKEPITVAIEMLARASARYVPENQMKELLERLVQEHGVSTKPLSLVDLAEQVGLLKKRKAARRA